MAQRRCRCQNLNDGCESGNTREAASRVRCVTRRAPLALERRTGQSLFALGAQHEIFGGVDGLDAAAWGQAFQADGLRSLGVGRVSGVVAHFQAEVNFLGYSRIDGPVKLAAVGQSSCDCCPTEASSGTAGGPYDACSGTDGLP